MTEVSNLPATYREISVESTKKGEKKRNTKENEK